MIDILTYAIARRKSAAKLDELYSQTKAVADAASVASASYALGPDESGRLSFFIKKST